MSSNTPANASACTGLELTLPATFPNSCITPIYDQNGLDNGTTVMEACCAQIHGTSAIVGGTFPGLPAYPNCFVYCNATTDAAALSLQYCVGNSTNISSWGCENEAPVAPVSTSTTSTPTATATASTSPTPKSAAGRTGLSNWTGALISIVLLGSVFGSL